MSATVTSKLEGLVKRVLGGGWTWARGHDDNMTGKGGRGEVATRTTKTKEDIHPPPIQQLQATAGSWQYSSQPMLLLVGSTFHC
jgi:hypothetical protein